MTAQAVGEVVESNDPRYSPGDLVVGQLGWQDYAVARGGSRAARARPFLDPPTLALHAVGATGFTAYFGLLDVGRPKPGDTVVVSGAAGAVGQIVGQIAKIAGCRTVGIAGGPEKCKECRLHGYDVGIDYKGEDLRAALKDACPDGVDVYFDNVGGEVSAAVVSRLNVGARIAICGQISQYNLERPEPTFHPGALIVYRARMEGFLVTDYAHRYDEAAVAPGPLGRRGQDPLDGARHRGPGERPESLHRNAERRKPRQGAGQDRRPQLGASQGK